MPYPFNALIRLALVAGVLGALSACAFTPGRVSALVHAPGAQPATVETAYGPVTGVSAPQGRAFLGVRYAAAPVGALRFRAPRPPRTWTAAQDATRPGPNCVQKALIGFGAQSEDCLTLNVYTDAQAAPDRPEPVMVFVYGGGFTLGAADQYDLSVLARRQHVVAVAMNYRIGAFGFLDTPALAAERDGAGDLALLDQQAALRWVKASIGAFGGDPADVTLFGESAGGWSVCSQLASPSARGLFERAIIESGPCTSPDSAISAADAETGGQAMAAKLGCADPATQSACLRALPAAAIQRAKPHRRGILGNDSWSPAYGNETLPVSPRAAFESGRWNVMPVVDGTNRDEARLFLGLGRWEGRLWTRGQYEKTITDFFGDATGRKVLAQYADVAARSPGLAYADVVTDSTFSCSALTLDGLLARQASVHAYEFDDPRAVSSLPLAPFTPPLRAYHASEIAYVLQAPWALADPRAFDPAQRALSDRMQAAWGAFARAGDPGEGGEAWTAYAPAAEPLRFTPAGDGAASDYAVAHRCAFWAPLGY